MLFLTTMARILSKWHRQCGRGEEGSPGLSGTSRLPLDLSLSPQIEIDLSKSYSPMT